MSIYDTECSPASAHQCRTPSASESRPTDTSDPEADSPGVVVPAPKTRKKPNLSASRRRAAACATGRTWPVSPTSPKAATSRGTGVSRRADARDIASGRSTAGSATRRPLPRAEHVLLRRKKVSSDARGRHPVLSRLYASRQTPRNGSGLVSRAPEPRRKGARPFDRSHDNWARNGLRAFCGKTVTGRRHKPTRSSRMPISREPKRFVVR
jgi:hypothetical protein